MATKVYKRKLYEIYFYHEGSYGHKVGNKGRLLPYRQAQRIANRLRRSGVTCTACPIAVNLTQQQIDYYATRYGRFRSVHPSY